MPRATLFEEDLEIKIFVWNSFTEDLYRRLMERKFKTSFKQKTDKYFEMPADAVDHLQEMHTQITEKQDPDDEPKIHFKKCPDCKQTKPISDYNKNQNTGDGLQSYCKICSAKRIHASYSKHKKIPDNHLSKKMLKQSAGADWDTPEIEILQQNFFKLGGKETGALKIHEQKLLPGRSYDEILNMAKHLGMMN